MAGLYIHIPFCKQACYYCDFHFSTTLHHKKELVSALGQELILQKEYLAGEALESIYIGGGTPSLLSVDELNFLFDFIHQHFSVQSEAEITLEANPDDLSARRVTELLATPINRLSIGIQSFYNPHLRFLNRAHNADEAISAVQLAQDMGLTNISIDLIYAIPHPDHSVWNSDLERATHLQVPHISAYCLTIEPQTVFGNWLRKGKLPPPDEQFAAEQFEQLVEHLAYHGYEQYEVSNFAQPNWYAQHNTNYWKNRKYLGIGPSAHSFNGLSRQFNVANNVQYLKAIHADTIPCTVEVLTPSERANEYIMTSLRTKWGCNTAYVQQLSGYNLMDTHYDYLRLNQQKALLHINGNVITLTTPGKLLADQIAADLFV